ncbi:inorganic phosphate transporter [Arcanobacterium haemolyticum]|nr:inorganic phosphate transporter [Arcanobacterium haemolyticum]
MNETFLLVAFIVGVAFIFDYTNGFHDAANAIATSVATRALTPRAALTMAAVMNFIGAMLGTAVASTIGGGIINISDAGGAHAGLVIVLGALIGAITWNLITWWFGLPSSSSHALIGGLCGAGLTASITVHWNVILDKVIVPMVLSPTVGFILAFVLMKIMLRLLVNASYKPTMRRFRHAQTVSAAALALGHGLQDAQKTMGVVTLALVAGGYHEDPSVIPTWVKLGAALAISLGTYSGGARIMKTLGQKIIDLDSSRGFVAELVGASVLFVTAQFHAPISTTHTITCAIMGVGATKRKSAVRWGIAGNIVTAWVLTLPAAAAVSALATWIFMQVIPM